MVGLQIFLLWMTHPSPRCSTAEGVQCCINPLRAHPPTVTTVHTLSEGRSAHELAEWRRRRRARERAANVRLTKSAVFKVRLKMLRKSKKEGEKKNPNCLFFALSIRRALHLKTIAQVARLRECLCMTEGVNGIPERCFKKMYIMGLGAESQRRDDKVAQISRAAVTTIFIQSPSFRRRWSPLSPPD